jgi:hypothetical protein
MVPVEDRPDLEVPYPLPRIAAMLVLERPSFDGQVVGGQQYAVFVVQVEVDPAAEFLTEGKPARDRLPRQDLQGVGVARDQGDAKGSHAGAEHVTGAVEGLADAATADAMKLPRAHLRLDAQWTAPSVRVALGRVVVHAVDAARREVGVLDHGSRQRRLDRARRGRGTNERGHVGLETGRRAAGIGLDVDERTRRDQHEYGEERDSEPERHMSPRAWIAASVGILIRASRSCAGARALRH